MYNSARKSKSVGGLRGRADSAKEIKNRVDEEMGKRESETGRKSKETEWFEMFPHAEFVMDHCCIEHSLYGGQRLKRF